MTHDRLSAGFSARCLQFTSDGRCVVCADRARVVSIDRGGATVDLALTGVEGIAAFADQLWIVRDGVLERRQLDGRGFGEAIELDGAGCLIPALAGPPAAAWVGTSHRAWFDDLGQLRDVELPAGALPFAGRRYFVRKQSGTQVALGPATWSLPASARLLAAGALFDGTGAVLLLGRRDGLELWSSTTSGRVQRRIGLPAEAVVRVAVRRGIVIVLTPDRLTAIDLQSARTIGEVEHDRGEVAIDPAGRWVALGHGTEVRIHALDELLATARAVMPELEHEPEPPGQPREEAPLLEPPRPLPQPSPLTLARPIEIPSLRPRSVARLDRARALAELDAELRLVLLRTVAAIAEGWDTRRIGYPNESANPHEHEVAAIVGLNHGFAQGHLAVARRELLAQMAAMPEASVRRTASSALGGVALDLALSPLAVDILLAIAAPAIWGDVARLYGILTNDAGRPIVDEPLLAQVLGVSLHDIARELDPRSALVQTGAVQVAAAPTRLFAALTVHPAVIARLRAEEPDLGGAVAIRIGSVALESLDVAASVITNALDQLARAGEPLRMVVRGRQGTGRRTLAAALIGETRRALGVLRASALPARDAFVPALRAALQSIQLAGLVPCVIELETSSVGERRALDVAGDVLRGHGGPLVLCMSPDAAAPLEPGHVAIDVPMLDETSRVLVWQRELAASGRWVRDPASLAARYRIGTGTIRRVIGALGPAGDGDAAGGEATDAIEHYIRQTRDGQIGTIAHRIERLASWSNLVLPPEVMDSLRELVARVRHRRRVFEDWGMNATMTTSRGITALFQGQPGTGKTLVAGVIARELALDLYQVDLSKVMSKWIGETERNLAAVFDAAEDGQAILLFDEADSLFAKRTEIRSSNDRYANLEVNYLLQRLDAFEGIAILTTNFGGSIDPAFKRRLSFCIQFPFPDEDTRVSLWRNHLPPQLPVSGQLAFETLAHKYQLSGGYIRNACLRAAFLAAQEESPLSQRHLERAVVLELTDAGKLSSSGALT